MSTLSLIDLTQRTALLFKISSIILSTEETVSQMVSSCLTCIRILLDSCPRCCQTIMDGLISDNVHWVTFFTRIMKILYEDAATSNLEVMESTMRIMMFLLTNGLDLASLRWVSDARLDNGQIMNFQDFTFYALRLMLLSVASSGI